ncbi:hypothetical protein E2C01_013774 [Portunus trituberculatus]|uniref:Uncharacterized protein n=1 Tax=Portunus trituberculatus TaxID=210409 RepID=A0A5B7DHZ3_PORTR|nr:hypothetical protein [Portunus trituberculatus]
MCTRYVSVSGERLQQQQQRQPPSSSVHCQQPRRRTHTTQHSRFGRPDGDKIWFLYVHKYSSFLSEASPDVVKSHKELKESNIGES